MLVGLLLVCALPCLAVCVTLLLLQRVGCCGVFGVFGDPLIFQHLFWYFGHPEVYIIIIPGFGVVSFVFVIVIGCVFGATVGMLNATLSIGVVGFCV